MQTLTVNCARDSQLQEILGLEKIPKKNFFNEFIHFLLKKSPDKKGLQERTQRKDSIYEEEAKMFSRKKILETQSSENDPFSDELRNDDIKIRKKPGFKNPVFPNNFDKTSGTLFLEQNKNCNLHFLLLY